MEIAMHKIKVAKIFDGYVNNGETGVSGYGGKLDIRPKYQRNFVYNDAQRDEVVRTVMKNFPLNVMYWIDHDDDTYEVMDGQQRTISICNYINNNFSVDEHYFKSLSQPQQKAILNYELTIYFCKSDDDSEKMNWFQVVNIAGERLFDQEIRNAVYAGKFVNNARSYFSQNNCAAYRIGNDYLKGAPIRQEYLETALKWIADKNHCTIEDYMSKHKFDTAQELMEYFEAVIKWLEKRFPVKNKFMKGLEWGILYNRYGNDKFNVAKDTKRVAELMADEDVTSKSGIYKYILSGDERHLNIRKFDNRTKMAVYKQQCGKCKFCKKIFSIEEMEADHIIAWSSGGKTVIENCQVLCKKCNRCKSNV